MCCSGMRCHMKTCSCVCMRCRNCEDCSHPFGIGMGAVVAGSIAGSLGGQIMKSVNSKPQPQLPTSPEQQEKAARDKLMRERSVSTSSTTSNGSTHGDAMVKAVGDNCVIQ